MGSVLNWLIYNNLSQWFFSTPLGELCWNGGPFMIPLAFCSILGLATIIVKFITLTMASVTTKRLLAQVNLFMEEKNIQGAVELCEITKGPVAAILLAGLRKVKDGSDRVLKAIENTGAIELTFLERGLVVLATLSNVSPMFGFLGTVSGMINAFVILVNPDVQDVLILELGFPEGSRLRPGYFQRGLFTQHGCNHEKDQEQESDISH